MRKQNTTTSRGSGVNITTADNFIPTLRRAGKRLELTKAAEPSFPEGSAPFIVQIGTTQSDLAERLNTTSETLRGLFKAAGIQWIEHKRWGLPVNGQLWAKDYVHQQFANGVHFEHIMQNLRDMNLNITPNTVRTEMNKYLGRFSKVANDIVRGRGLLDRIHPCHRPSDSSKAVPVRTGSPGIYAMHWVNLNLDTISRELDMPNGLIWALYGPPGKNWITFKDYNFIKANFWKRFGKAPAPLEQICKKARIPKRCLIEFI
jgi:hypothetical protein